MACLADLGRTMSRDGFWPESRRSRGPRGLLRPPLPCGGPRPDLRARGLKASTPDWPAGQPVPRARHWPVAPGSRLLWQIRSHKRSPAAAVLLSSRALRHFPRLKAPVGVPVAPSRRSWFEILYSISTIKTAFSQVERGEYGRIETRLPRRCRLRAGQVLRGPGPRRASRTRKPPGPRSGDCRMGGQWSAQLRTPRWGSHLFCSGPLWP
jgi:hypothetical protein